MTHGKKTTKRIKVFNKDSLKRTQKRLQSKIKDHKIVVTETSVQATHKRTGKRITVDFFKDESGN